MAKRERSKVFSKDEEEDVWSLAKKYWNVIQCKKTDHENNRYVYCCFYAFSFKVEVDNDCYYVYRKKADAWLAIEREFNAGSINGNGSGTHRNAHSIKLKFENLLRRARNRAVTAQEQPVQSEGASKIDEELLVSLVGECMEAAGEDKQQLYVVRFFS